jgi:RHS repeat-associated protein
VNLTTGEIVQEMDYDEFGKVLKNTNESFQPFTYAGGLYDVQTGLIRFGARDYDSKIGRWTAKDPIGFGKHDLNFYLYCNNNPIYWLDPSGLYWIERKVLTPDDLGPELSYTTIWGQVLKTGDIVYIVHLDTKTSVFFARIAAVFSKSYKIDWLKRRGVYPEDPSAEFNAACEDIASLLLKLPKWVSKAKVFRAMYEDIDMFDFVDDPNVRRKFTKKFGENYWFLSEHGAETEINKYYRWYGK